MKHRTAILIIEGEQFHSTWQDEKEAKECLLRLQTYEPNRGYSLKNFGVIINTINPDTFVVRDWHKEEGWSIWFSC